MITSFSGRFLALQKEVEDKLTIIVKTCGENYWDYLQTICVNNVWGFTLDASDRISLVDNSGYLYSLWCNDYADIETIMSVTDALCQKYGK